MDEAKCNGWLASCGGGVLNFLGGNIVCVCWGEGRGVLSMLQERSDICGPIP